MQAIIPVLTEIIDNILVGHISDQAGVPIARRTTPALFFFLYTPLNKFLSRILVHSITS